MRTLQSNLANRPLLDLFAQFELDECKTPEDVQDLLERHGYESHQVTIKNRRKTHPVKLPNGDSVPVLIVVQSGGLIVDVEHSKEFIPVMAYRKWLLTTARDCIPKGLVV